jgi:hypothetical protein
MVTSTEAESESRIHQQLKCLCLYGRDGDAAYSLKQSVDNRYLYRLVHDGEFVDQEAIGDRRLPPPPFHSLDLQKQRNVSLGPKRHWTRA